MRWWLIAALLAFAGALAVASASAQTAQDMLRWQREDVAAFRRDFIAADHAFTKLTRAIAELRLRRIERRTEAMRPTDFAVELCRIAALADNGHTGCISTAQARGMCDQMAAINRTAGAKVMAECAFHEPDFVLPAFNRVSLQLFPFGGDFYVVGAADETLLGARVERVDGRSIASIRPLLRSFSGGPIQARDLFAAVVLTSPMRLHSVGVSRSDTSLSYAFVLANGARAERAFVVGAAGGATLRKLPDPARAPWAFQNPDEPFRWRDAPDMNAIVVQLRINVDSEKLKIADFLRQTLREYQRLGRTHYVLDLRLDSGGNGMLTRDFMAGLPQRVPGRGRIFVLTSRRTFSAGITNVAYLEQAGGDRVVIVGEPVGDRLMFFGQEGPPVRLPHSGLFMQPGRARTDLRNGCRGYDDCIAALAQPGAPSASPPAIARSVERHPVSVQSLEPDIAAPWTIQSWIEGTDPALEAVARAVAGGAK